MRPRDRRVDVPSNAFVAVLSGFLAVPLVTLTSRPPRRWWSTPLTDYAGFGMPVLAPADGQIVGVAENYPDNPPGTNGDRANHLVIDIDGDRSIVLVHIEQGSATVQVGDLVRQGQPLAAVGNDGHLSAPHLHIHVQDTPSADDSADRTYPMLFRNVEIIRGGLWPGVTAANCTPATWSAHSGSSDDSILSPVLRYAGVPPTRSPRCRASS